MSTTTEDPIYHSAATIASIADQHRRDIIGYLGRRGFVPIRPHGAD
jgi:hypothetical protein